MHTIERQISYAQYKVNKVYLSSSSHAPATDTNKFRCAQWKQYYTSIAKTREKKKKKTIRIKYQTQGAEQQGPLVRASLLHWRCFISSSSFIAKMLDPKEKYLASTKHSEEYAVRYCRLCLKKKDWVPANSFYISS